MTDLRKPSELLKSMEENGEENMDRIDAKNTLLTLLQRAVTAELAAVIQYMWQSITVTGLFAETLKGTFMGIAKAEMEHAKQVADRLNYLYGADPSTVPDYVMLGRDVATMLQNDITSEVTAIQIYRQIAEVAHDLEDKVTCLMAKEILTEEEDHHNTLITLAGQNKGGV